ncbi:MAG: serine/threonine-protein phosphatase [Candidatus Eisenbacteria bacterium]|nr:serine/threonine-protein phosphatase [Candidatus Eisenbacteria bacterium]
MSHPSLESSLTLQCMEVLGGNTRTFRKIEMHGIDAWVSTDPLGGPSGGDVHYLSSCGTGRIIRILVADVSGHGQEVARVAGELAGVMRRHVNTLDQNLFVRALNREFKTLIERGQFATAVSATFFGPTCELEVTNAGHPRPLLFRASTRRWSALEGPPLPEGKVANLPLGILDKVHYFSHSSRLARGDFVLLYSDAVTESVGPAGNQLGESGLIELVSALDPPVGESFLESLVAALQNWRSTALDDDETLLLFSPNEMRPDTTFAGRLRGTLQMVRSFSAAVRRGEGLPIPDAAPANIGGAMVPALSRLWSRKSPGGER